MSRAKAILRIDYSLAATADNARTALTSVAFTNNGGIVRGTKTAHGLVSMAAVTVSASTSYDAEWLVNRIDADIFELYISNAEGTITVTETPVANETFVVGAQTFTFKATRSTTGEVTISADNVQQAKNIVAAIMTDIAATIFAYCHETNIVTVMNILGGAAGNSTVLTESATGIAVSGSGTLAGGVNSTYIADRSGTVTPFGGQSWADAWATVNSGATSARTAPGDIILLAQSPLPTAIGNATWNNNSKTVTLAGALNDTVELCDSGWSNGANGTASHDTTYRKEGSACLKIITGATAGATELAYIDLGADKNWSSDKQQISLWVRNETSALAAAGDLQVRMYDDSARANLVETFNIPAIPSTARWVPITINKGSAFSNKIRSVAIWNGVTNATKTYYIDNIITVKAASAANALSLTSLISLNPSCHSGTEGFYGIQSIVDTVVLLDNDTNAIATAGRGYGGSTTGSPTATYKIESIKTTMGTAASTNIVYPNESGNSTLGRIEYQGGYDTATSIQSGDTHFDGQNGMGYGLALAVSFITINRLSFSRYGIGINNNIANVLLVVVQNLNNNTVAGYSAGFSSFNGRCINLKNVLNNTSNGISLSDKQTIDNANTCNNNASGVTTSYFWGTYIKNLITRNNTAGINSPGRCNLYNALITETTEIYTTGYNYYNFRVYSQLHDKGTDTYIFTDMGYMKTDATTRHTEAGFAWSMYVQNVLRNINYPLDMKVATVGCKANEAITFRLYVKKSHASDIGARLCIRGGQIAGVPWDVQSAVHGANTDWEQLTVTITPTENGVVELECWAYWLANTADEYVTFDDLSFA
jgi:hypothetical protein